MTRYAALVRLDPKEVPAFTDDLDQNSLHAAALQSLSYYQSLPENQLFVLGVDTYTVQDLVASMAALINLLEGSPDRRDWLTVLNQTFNVYQSVGVDPDKDRRVFIVLRTHHPRAWVSPIRAYQYPLYARPDDLVDVDLSLFDPCVSRCAHCRAARRPSACSLSHPR